MKLCILLLIVMHNVVMQNKLDYFSLASLVYCNATAYLTHLLGMKNVVMLRVIMLNVVMLRIIMLSVAAQNIIMLNAMAP
jgi:hypothetical protein